ncbi:MAG: hypothetical protein GWN62_16890 [Aliifodinibius sp.]|nr:hypothetical protein [Fodinibius sp.]
MAEKRVTINIEGFRKKMDNLASLNSFFNNVTQDAADFFRSKLISEQQNAAENVAPFSQVGSRRILRRITGNLNRSFAANVPGVLTTKSEKGKIRTIIKIVPQANVASYGEHVYNHALTRTGKNPMAWTKFYYQKQIKSIATKAFNKAIKDIAQGKIYRYRNPYPPVPSR